MIHLQFHGLHSSRWKILLLLFVLVFLGVFLSSNRGRDVPDRPEPVVVTYRTSTSVFLSWKPSNEYDSATEVFLVYMNSTWDGGLWKIIRMLPAGARRAKVELQPWTSYNFCVQQMNGVGYSELSHPSAAYMTPASKPDLNPNNVRVEIINGSHIRVKWKPMRRRKFNGPGFHYLLSWRRRSGLDETWNTRRIENPATNSSIIDIVDGRYEIRVRASNIEGMAPIPLAVNVFCNTSIETDSGVQSHNLESLTAPESFQAIATSSTEITVKWRSLERTSTVGTLHGYVVSGCNVLHVSCPLSHWDLVNGTLIDKKLHLI